MTDRAEAGGDSGAGGSAPDRTARAHEATVRIRPEVVRSTAPGIGRALTVVKRSLLRLLDQPLDDLAAQTSGALDQASAQARRAREWAEHAVSAEAREREATQRDLQTVLRRIETLEAELGRMQPGARLARLERTERRGTAAGAGAPAAATPPDALSAARPPLDYLTFEERFRGSEKAIRDHQSAYRELLAGRRRVVDLGCGRGELVELLIEAGVEAYGVELNEDFVDLVRAKGLEVVQDDATVHLEGLATGEVDGIVLSHVVEHLPPHAVTHIVETAWEKLAEGGLLIMETPNPESLVAGSINFHRDPTHLRPVHPDTLAFICESAGFASVEIRRLSPIPDEQRLPLGGAGGGPLADHLDLVVGRLNELLYGFQDYAVVAGR